MKNNFNFFAGVFVIGLLFYGCGNAESTSENAEIAVKTGASSGESISNISIKEGPVDMELYAEYLKIGEFAEKEGNFQEALKNYNFAAQSNNSPEIQEKIAETIEKIYQEFFQKGMKFFNEKNYLYAKKEFHTARLYKNGAEINEMIDKCKAME